MSEWNYGTIITSIDGTYMVIKKAEANPRQSWFVWPLVGVNAAGNETSGYINEYRAFDDDPWQVLPPGEVSLRKDSRL